MILHAQAISRYEAAFGSIEIGRTPDVPDVAASHEEMGKPN